MRDMTKRQFERALTRYGMRFQGFMGYVDLGIPDHRVCASIFNAGASRRARLAYLLDCRTEHEKQIQVELHRRQP